MSATKKEGVHPNQNLGWDIGDLPIPDVLKKSPLTGGLSPTEFQKQLMNDWNCPTEPVIEKTPGGQWRVTWQDKSQVFALKNRAEEYAHELMQKGKWTAPDPKPKPVPTTLDPSAQKVNVVGGTAEEKSAYISQLKNVLKASGPDAFPKELLKKILGYSEDPTTKQVAISILQQAMGQPVGPLELFQTLQIICTDIKCFLNGAAEVKPGTMAYVKAFIDLVDLPATPKTVAGPSTAVPPTTGTVPTEPPAPPIDKTVRKKRTIRKIQD